MNLDLFKLGIAVFAVVLIVVLYKVLFGAKNVSICDFC